MTTQVCSSTKADAKKPCSGVGPSAGPKGRASTIDACLTLSPQEYNSSDYPSSLVGSPSWPSPIVLLRSRIELGLYLFLFLVLLMRLFFLLVVADQSASFGLIGLVGLAGGGFLSIGLYGWWQGGECCWSQQSAVDGRSREFWQLRSADGARVEVEGLWSLMPWLMLIRIKSIGVDGGWKRRMLWPDSADAESLRALRAALFGGH